MSKEKEIEKDGFITPERYIRSSKPTKPIEGEGIERHYNLNEVSVLLGIKVRTAREWIHNGKMKAVKYTNSPQWYVPESEIRRIQHGDNSEQFTS